MSEQPPTVVAATVREHQAELWLPCRTRLGECPRWDEVRGVMGWLDIDGRRFLRAKPEATTMEDVEVFELPARAGAFCTTLEGDYIFAFEDGFGYYNPETSTRTNIAEDFEAGLPTRLNDGRVDRLGRFVCGGHTEKGSTPQTAVYRLNTDLSVEKLLGPIRTCNAIAFSPTDGSMYFTDTMAGDPHIYRFRDYESTSMAGEMEAFAKPAGKPDGSALDTEGGLWNAEFGGGQVVRYGSTGCVTDIVKVPVPYTTCPSFGGEDLSTLYVTDASLGRLTKTKKEAFPEEILGGIYRVQLPYKGVLERRFAGGLGATGSDTTGAS